MYECYEVRQVFEQHKVGASLQLTKGQTQRKGDLCFFDKIIDFNNDKKYYPASIMLCDIFYIAYFRKKSQFVTSNV